MLFKLMKIAVVSFVIFTSKTAESLNTSNPFPGCPKSRQWCDNEWAPAHNYTPPLNKEDLIECLSSQDCCYSESDNKSIVYCPDYKILALTFSNVGMLGFGLTLLICSNKVCIPAQINKFLIALGMTLTPAGISGILGILIYGLGVYGGNIINLSPEKIAKMQEVYIYSTLSGGLLGVGKPLYGVLSYGYNLYKECKENRRRRQIHPGPQHPAAISLT